MAPQATAYAIGVLRDIYAFHRYTTNSTILMFTQEAQYQRRRMVEPRDLTTDLSFRLRSL